ncbi:hypothetical protein M3Y99_01177700 [Aphelenchoides fujianensis]|nr:hypothetical protein M3Y99_01177700 [Aphelenchoides fujianensis]
MSFAIDDFERQAALRIDGSRKTIEELVVELRTMLDSRLFIGEEVRFGSIVNSKIGSVIDCIDLQAAEGIERKYAVLCEGKLHKNLDSAQLKRTGEVSDVELRKFISRAAVQSFAMGTWSLRENHWSFYNYAVNRNAYINWKQTEETCQKEQRKKAVVGTLMLVLVLCAFVIHTSGTKITLVCREERPNIRFADDALHSMRQMNDETVDHFWKSVVTDDKLNLADPSVLEGIAHLFAFESTHSNRTTLREYVGSNAE